jgi:hypothetical protein
MKSENDDSSEDENNDGEPPQNSDIPSDDSSEIEMEYSFQLPYVEGEDDRSTDSSSSEPTSDSTQYSSYCVLNGEVINENVSDLGNSTDPDEDSDSIESNSSVVADTSFGSGDSDDDEPETPIYDQIITTMCRIKRQEMKCSHINCPDKICVAQKVRKTLIEDASTTRKNLPYININVEGIPVLGMADTGASVSIIGPKFMKALEESMGVNKILEMRQKARGRNAHAIDVTTVNSVMHLTSPMLMKIKISEDSPAKNAIFYYAPESRIDILVGNKVLKGLGYQLIAPGTEDALKDIHPRKSEVENTEGKEQLTKGVIVTPASATKSTLLDEMHIVCIGMHTNSQVKDGTYCIMTRSWVEKAGLQIPDQLLLIKNEKFILRVANMNNISFEIPAGLTLVDVREVVQLDNVQETDNEMLQSIFME